MAAALGVSHGTLDKIEKAAAIVKANPERDADLADAMSRPGAKVDPIFREAKQREASKNADAANPVAPPTKPAPLGVGIDRAVDAIAALKRIPPGDPRRREGYKMVANFIKHNIGVVDGPQPAPPNDGWAIRIAHEAINVLQRIAHDDTRRAEALRIERQWIHKTP